MKFTIFQIFLINIILFKTFNCSFQISIFRELNKKGKNLIISPLSIFQILSLTSNGAKNETQNEMIQALQNYNIDDLNQINYDILEVAKNFKSVDIANSVMSKFTPLPSFLEIADKYYAPHEKLISAEQVNNWCSEKTHGKISKIIDKLEDDIEMILINAVYFKGKWSYKFEEKATIKKPFYNFGTQMKEIDTMRQLTRLSYYEDEKIQAVSLPYTSDGISALVVLPRENIDINKYIISLDLDKYNINQIVDNLKFAKVNLELPKFELEYYSSLKEVLIDMGMEQAFTPEADFSGLREENHLKIDEVLHKTYLKVNENGTEAAAVTAVVIEKTSARPTPETIYQMKVNRPFLFIIRSNRLPFENDILFISKIENID